MSDFTKEELIQLQKWAANPIDFSPSELEINLFNKIQSAIDGYCEHSQAKSKTMNVFKCIKCQRVF